MWFVLGGLESLRLSSRGGGEAGAPAEDRPEVPGIHKRWGSERSPVPAVPCSLLTLLDPSAVLSCWSYDARMWKFKAFCLDYWHVLCLHPHNNFYKRYVVWGKNVSHAAVTFLLHPFLLLPYFGELVITGVLSACWCRCLCWDTSDIKQIGVFVNGRQYKWLMGCCVAPHTDAQADGKTLLGGVQAGWTLSDIEHTRFWPLGLILFSFWHRWKERDDLALTEFIHCCPIGTFPHSPFTHCNISAWLLGRAFAACISTRNPFLDE